MTTSSTRYLPTYQDAVVSYSLRLPTYRSSYIHRYHPYARYTPTMFHEQITDEIKYDELLDLSILDRRVETVRLEPTSVEEVNLRPNPQEFLVEEQPNEPDEAPIPVANTVANTEAINSNADNQEDLNEQPDQNIVFIRVVQLNITPSP